jgi:hypothetical protein
LKLCGEEVRDASPPRRFVSNISTEEWQAWHLTLLFKEMWLLTWGGAAGRALCDGHRLLTIAPDEDQHSIKRDNAAAVAIAMRDEREPASRALGLAGS